MLTKSLSKNLLSVRALFVLGVTFFAAACSSSDDDAPTSGDISARIGLSGVTQNFDGSEEKWRELLDGARVAQVSFLHLQAAPWSEAETASGAFDFSYFDPFVRLNESYRFAYTLDLATPLGLGAPDVPSDLAGIAFDDPLLLVRYKAYIFAALRKLSAATEVVLHTETAGPFFENDERSESFLAYCRLIGAAADYVRELRPGVRVGVYGTKNESPGILQCLNRSTDFFGIGYIGDRGDEDYETVISSLADQAGDKPIGFFEAGIPTAARLGGTEERQSEFVHYLFSFAAARGSRLSFLSYFQRIDLDESVVRGFVPTLFAQYSDAEREDAVAFFTSLGLVRADGTPKPAWELFRTQRR